MRNRWSVEKLPLIGWIAEMDEELLGEVLRAGEECDVHRVLDAPDLGFDRAAEGRSYPDFLSGVAVSGPRVPFSAAWRVAALVAHADADGAIVENEVADLAPLVPDHLEHLRRHQPPLEVRPIRVPEGLWLLVSSCSDIWLPWCSDYDDEGLRRADPADNRELAARHTPRLNAFLAEVAELARRSGGGLRRDPDTTERRFESQVDDHGVRLDTVGLP